MSTQLSDSKIEEIKKDFSFFDRDGNGQIDLPEFIELDVAALELGSSIHLSEVTLPENVRSIALSHGEDHDRAIVSVHVTRAAAEETDEVDEETEASEEEEE